MPFPAMGVKAVVENSSEFFQTLGRMGSEVQNTTRDMGRMGGVDLGGLGRSLGGVALAAAGIATAAGAAGLAIGGIVIREAINAAPLYDIQQAFLGITQASGQTADAVLAQWQEASRGTIRATDLMENYNLSTQLLGQSLTDQVVDVLPLIGRVASATGQDTARLTNDFIRGIGRLSPMILDNLGITVDLSEAYQDYADSLGISVDEMTKEQQQAALLQVALAKLAENTAAIPDVGETAAGQMAALKVQFQDLRDSISLQLVPAVMPLLTRFSELAQQYLPQLSAVITEKVIPVIMQVAEWLAENLPGAIAAAVDFFGRLQTKAGEAANFWTTTLQPALQAVGNFISGTLGPVLEILGNIWKTIILPAIQVVWQFLSTYLMPVLGAVAHIVSAVLVTAFRVMWAFLTNKVIPVLRTVWSWISDKLGPVFQWLGDMIATVRIAIDPVLQLMHEFGDLIMGWELPDWLTRHSPSEFEVTMQNVADSLKTMRAPSILANPLAPAPVVVTPSAARTSTGMERSSTSNFNLNVNTAAPMEPIVADFRLMAALARRR